MMKQLICVGLCVLCLLNPLVIAYGQEETEPVLENYILGDVNGDNTATAVDALWILKYAVGKMELTEQQRLVADVGGIGGSDEEILTPDGKVDAMDALIVLWYASSSGPFKLKFPQE